MVGAPLVLHHTLVNLLVDVPGQTSGGPKNGSGVLRHQNRETTQQRLHLLDFALGVVQLVVLKECRTAFLHAVKGAALDKDQLPPHLSHGRDGRVGPYPVLVLRHHLLDHLDHPGFVEAVDFHVQQYRLALVQLQEVKDYHQKLIHPDLLGHHPPAVPDVNVLLVVDPDSHVHVQVANARFELDIEVPDLPLGQRTPVLAQALVRPRNGERGDGGPVGDGAHPVQVVEAWVQGRVLVEDAG